VYTFQFKGYVAAVGKEYQYIKLKHTRTLNGKLIKLVHPLNNIVVPMELIQSNYQTATICTEKCKFMEGKWIHYHDRDVLLMLKMT